MSHELVDLNDYSELIVLARIKVWHILDRNSASSYVLVPDDDNNFDDGCEYFFVKNLIDVHPDSITMRMQNVDDAVNARDPMMNLKY
jgi:hypothetical protein